MDCEDYFGNLGHYYCDIPNSNIKYNVGQVVVGTNLKSDKDYELVIGGMIDPPIRVIMTPDEHKIIADLLIRAQNNSPQLQRKVKV